MPMPSMPLISTMSPGPASVGLLALQALELEHLVDARLDRRAVRAAVHGHVLHRLERALVDAADADAADVGGVVERADLQLQRRRPGSPSCAGTCSSMASNSGVRSVPTSPCCQRGPAVQARGVDHREVELLLGGASLSNRSKVALMT